MGFLEIPQLPFPLQRLHWGRPNPGGWREAAGRCARKRTAELWHRFPIRVCLLHKKSGAVGDEEISKLPWSLKSAAS